MSADLRLRSQKEKRPFQSWDQVLVLTGISLQDVGDGAIVAKVGRPFQIVGFKQAAGFYMPAAVIVPVKMAAFLAGGCDHLQKL